MSYEDNTYGNPKPRTFEEKAKAWAEGKRPGLLKNINIPKEFELDFLDLDMEIEFDKIYRESK